MRYFTSDLHFWHKNIIQPEYGGRPWTTVEDMNEGLIGNWNAVVQPEDEIVMTGDMFFCGMTKAKAILTRLNGIKDLYLGNHDWHILKPHRAQELGFRSIQKNGTLKLEGLDDQVMISHFPYKDGGDHSYKERYVEHRLEDRGYWLLHGHVHHKWRVKQRQINVGVDVWNYRPVSEEELVTLIKNQSNILLGGAGELA